MVKRVIIKITGKSVRITTAPIVTIVCSIHTSKLHPDTSLIWQVETILGTINQITNTKYEEEQAQLKMVLSTLAMLSN
jgi:hypothetical protein